MGPNSKPFLAETRHFFKFHPHQIVLDKKEGARGVTSNESDAARALFFSPPLPPRFGVVDKSVAAQTPLRGGLRLSRAALDLRTTSQDVARTAKRHWGEERGGQGLRPAQEARKRP